MLLNGLVAGCSGERVGRGGELWAETRRWMAEYRLVSAGFEIAESIQADTTAWSKFHLSKGNWIRRGHGSTDDANSLALGARNMEGSWSGLGGGPQSPTSSLLFRIFSLHPVDGSLLHFVSTGRQWVWLVPMKILSV